MSDLEYVRGGPRGKPNSEIRHADLGVMRVPVFADVQKASATLGKRVVRTPVMTSARLDLVAGGTVWLKAESLQVTGSFKARGALNALLSMSTEQLREGVIAYSTGNHGQAIAWAAKQLGVRATIVMPHDAPRNKIERARFYGASVVHYDRTRESREAIGMRLLNEMGGTLIPPGDHAAVIAGQGTVALEAWHQLPDRAREELAIFISPCGGGGLVAGCGLVIDHLAPGIALCAVEPEGLDDTVRSLKASARERNDPSATSASDALQAMTPAELPFEINRQLLDRACSVSEKAVEDAVRFAANELRLVVEPGGAVALAAVLSGRIRLSGGHALVVLSGGNIDASLLANYLAISSA